MKTISTKKMVVAVVVAGLGGFFAQTSVAGDKPTTVKFQRKIGNVTSTFEVTCPAGGDENTTCDMNATNGTQVTTSKIKVAKVREALAQYFSSVPEGEVRDTSDNSRGPAFIPSNAALVYEVTAGRQATIGGATIDDVNGMKLAKKKVLESIAWLERQLTVFRE